MVNSEKIWTLYGYWNFIHSFGNVVFEKIFKLKIESMNDYKTNRPTQAVILAGGLGIRLRPITDTIPKPMITFHGKPFLEYIIEMLVEQGFKKVVLLLGYLPEKVIEYFGDGKKFGLEIEYSITDVEDDTGLRLQKAKHLIDPIFTLLYCDNYWPMDFEKMWDKALRNTEIIRSRIKILKTNKNYFCLSPPIKSRSSSLFSPIISLVFASTISLTTGSVFDILNENHQSSYSM